jgi:hypothetical protein
MSVTDHSSTPEGALSQTKSGYNRPCNEARDDALKSLGTPEHLRAIHELVRSGDYSVPATVIADRMIERLIGDKRGQGA